MGYYNEENQIDVVILALFIDILATILCCVFCPGEGLIVIGVLKFISGMLIIPDDTDQSSAMKFGSLLGAFIWVTCGTARIKKRNDELARAANNDEDNHDPFIRAQAILARSANNNGYNNRPDDDDDSTVIQAQDSLTTGVGYEMVDTKEELIV